MGLIQSGTLICMEQHTNKMLLLHKNSAFICSRDATLTLTFYLQAFSAESSSPEGRGEVVMSLHVWKHTYTSTFCVLIHCPHAQVGFAYSTV